MSMSKAQRLQLEKAVAKLPVPSELDKHPPTYHDLFSFCRVLQMMGGYETMDEMMIGILKGVNLNQRCTMGAHPRHIRGAS